MVILLGLLAAIMMPQFGEAANTTRENMLRENLRMMRTQIGCYQAQHNDVNPGFPNGDINQVPTEDLFIDQLTLYTNARGQTSSERTDQYCYGPYMSEIPENPINRLTSVLMLDDDDAIPAAADFGWVFKPSAYFFIPGGDVDSQGRPFAGY